jgi:hypothetical protein
MKVILAAVNVSKVSGFDMSRRKQTTIYLYLRSKKLWNFPKNRFLVLCVKVFGAHSVIREANCVETSLHLERRGSYHLSSCRPLNKNWVEKLSRDEYYIRDAREVRPI